MKYLIVGAGGIGGSMAGMLARAGKDAVLIMRGKNLEAVREDGFYLTAYYDGSDELEERRIENVICMSWDEYRDTGEVPDVIFLCTKSYSVEYAAHDVNSIAGAKTIIIPILNGIKMGEYVKRFVTEGRIVEGCIYMCGERTAPGRFSFTTDFMRVVFGAEREGVIADAEAEAIERDMNEAGIRTTYSKNVLRDMLRKFSGVAPASVAEIIHGCKAKALQEPGVEQDTYIEAVREVEALSKALGAPPNVDLVEKAVKLAKSFPPDNVTSMVSDILAGKRSEFENQIIGAVALGKSAGVEMPTFSRAIAVMKAAPGSGD